MTTPPPSKQPPLKEEATEKQVEKKSDVESKLEDEEEMPSIEPEKSLMLPNVSLGLYLLLSIVMICIGVITLMVCPKEFLIPLFLAMAGTAGVVAKVIAMANRNRKIILDRIVFLIWCVEIVCVVLGAFWTNGPFNAIYDNNEESYCSLYAHTLHFWLFMLNLFILFNILLLLCHFKCDYIITLITGVKEKLETDVVDDESLL